MYKVNIRNFFDNNYRNYEHYWWKGDNRYSVSEKDHTPFYAFILSEARRIGHGNALDLGAGEGADSIRLAKLGFEVDAIEMSPVGAKKIQLLANDMQLKLNVICEDIEKIEPIKQYDIVMCNGVLHYVKNKNVVIEKMQRCTKSGGINSISLFSDYSPIPVCHQIVPVFADSEGGVVEQKYAEWNKLFLKYEREKLEKSHDDMEEHVHSFIKGIWRKP